MVGEPKPVLVRGRDGLWAGKSDDKIRCGVESSAGSSLTDQLVPGQPTSQPGQAVTAKLHSDIVTTDYQPSKPSQPFQ